MMIGQHRIFADHYQFYVFDSKSDPHDINEEWSEEVIKKGYLQGLSSIHIVTIGDYNDHAVSIHAGSPEKTLSEGDHEVFTDIVIKSGKVKLSSPAYSNEEEPEYEIGKGAFKLTIRSLNIGIEDPDAIEELEDIDFFKLKHLERYELYFQKKT